jgi:opacity protein-like surface antigen
MLKKTILATKKIILAGVITMLTVGIAAAAAVPYVGGSLGISNTTSDDIITTTGTTSGFARGVPLTLFVGYGGVLNESSLYFAGELFGTVGTAEISSNNSTNSGTPRNTYGFGLSALPGVMLSDHTLAFLRVGVVRSEFTNGGQANGGQLGIGLQTALTQNVDMRLEYDFTAYEDVGVIDHPRTDAVNLGIIYKFN